MDVKKGDILVFIGQETDALKSGEEVTVISKDPKGATIEFDDGSKKKVPYNILKQDWELRQSDEPSEEGVGDDVTEDQKEEVAETKEEVNPKKEKQPKKEKATTGMKKLPNEEAVKNRKAFFEACTQAGCEVIEQSPFFAVKYNGRPIFEVLKSKQRFAINCNEKALTEDMKELGNIIGHGRSNDFRIQDKSIDELLPMIPVYIENFKILAEERKQQKKEAFEAVRTKKGQNKEKVEA